MEATNIFDIIFSPVVKPLTIASIIMVTIWLISMISGIDGDIDFDVDVDADLDLDIESGIEGGTFEVDDPTNAEITKEAVVGKRQKQLKWWQVFLIYFNFVELPFLLMLTIFIFTWWLLSMFATMLTHTYANSLGFLIEFALFIPALFVTKIISSPLKPLFKQLNKSGDVAIDFLGRKGTSLSSISGNKLGNAEIVVKGSPMSIYIKSETGEPIAFRSQILIIRESKDKTFYFAQNYKD